MNEDGGRLNGLALLSQFVTDKESLSYVRKRNIQIKRWEQARQKRIEAGLAADPAQPDPSVLAAMMEQFRAQMAAKPVQQKSFHPDLGSALQKQDAQKNYIVRKRFGANRHIKPKWNDPNPVKYGGPYGMQHMKEQLDTGYQRLRKEHLETLEEQRKASLSPEEREEEERLEEAERLFVEQNRARITDLNDVKKYTIDSTLRPHERSFLIQPEKPSNRKRIPQIFGQP